MKLLSVSLNNLFSDECIRNCDNEVNALSLIDSLPELNKQLLVYLVDFLKVMVCLWFQVLSKYLCFHPQQFITPENIEATKMGLDNIAMVWAPNFLRCPSDDHTLIFQNTRKEMAFLRVLLRLLDTNNSASASTLQCYVRLMRGVYTYVQFFFVCSVELFVANLIVCFFFLFVVQALSA